MLVEPAFGVNHAADEIRIEMMLVADGVDDLIQLLRLQGLRLRASGRGQGRRSGRCGGWSGCRRYGWPAGARPA